MSANETPTPTPATPSTNANPSASVEGSIQAIANAKSICEMYPPGSLNPATIADSPFPTHDAERHSNIDALNSTMQKAHYGTGPSSLKGPFLGIVVWIKSKKEDPGEPFQLSDRLTPVTDSGTEQPKLVEIKAWIPEMNYWGCPRSPLDSPSAEDKNIIASLPTFVAKHESIPEPALYDIVWLDFQVMGDFTTGIYLEPTSDYLPKAGGVAAGGALGN